MSYPVRVFESAVITNVVDGDTCDISVNLGFSVKVKTRFRLARIDTPERGRPGWQEATDFLNKYLDKPVILHSTKIDKYGRYLAEIFVESPSGSLSINQMIIDNGLGIRYKG